MFNNREIASVIWASLFVTWMLFVPSFRKSVGHLIEAFFRWKILTCLLLMSLYTCVIVIIFYQLGVWVPELLKDTILWFIFSAFVLVMEFMTASTSKGSFLKLVKDNLKLIIVMEFIIGAYTFDLWVELLFIPVVTFFVLLNTVAGLDEKHADVKKLTGWIIAVFVILVIVIAINNAIGDWKNLGTIDTLRALALPSLLSIAFIPFIYGALLVSEYEKLFIYLNFGRDKTTELKRYAKRRIIGHCGLSLNKLRKLSSVSFRFSSIETINDVDGIFISNK